MAFRSDISIAWDASPRMIRIQEPSTSVLIQDLHDTLVALEDSLDGMGFPNIVSSAGKETLGEGIQVGITLTLLNAQIEFEARFGPTYVQCVITGGNIVALDDNGDLLNPVFPTAFTQVVLEKSASATLAAQTSLHAHIVGGRSIDFTGNDGMGWQRVEYNESGAEVKRYNLYDETDARITVDVDTFITTKKMVARETVI